VNKVLDSDTLLIKHVLFLSSTYIASVNLVSLGAMGVCEKYKEDNILHEMLLVQ
jgi:hypothetical protein